MFKHGFFPANDNVKLQYEHLIIKENQQWQLIILLSSKKKSNEKR